MQRPTNVAILGLVALLLAGACATAPVNPQTRERARQKVLAGDSCPEKQIVHEDANKLVFVVSGCNLVAKVSVACDSAECVTTAVSGSPLPQPQRLKSDDQRVWHATDMADSSPAAAAPTPASTEPVVIKAGKRLTPLGNPDVTPVLPPELKQSGFLVWGLFKVCVAATGQVQRVDVVRSALPGGFDRSWIAKIEKWRYDAYQVSGRPVPFCFPLRLQVGTT
jgi:hypothetical protein